MSRNVFFTVSLKISFEISFTYTASASNDGAVLYFLKCAFIVSTNQVNESFSKYLVSRASTICSKNLLSFNNEYINLI